MCYILKDFVKDLNLKRNVSWPRIVGCDTIANVCRFDHKTPFMSKKRTTANNFKANVPIVNCIYYIVIIIFRYI